MRLTLRTLLAYLDDTLEPSQARLIGQKVAESDAAQELIARIKQVTRRRRLTTPPITGPGAKLDPNTIAEYLDNELPADQLASVEEICLGSDVHLAELAACHQILTLVLGEPALVPPVAQQRMYGLIQGREAIPYRKPPAPRPAGGAADKVALSGDEMDEALLLGLPRDRSSAPWLLPAAAVLLLVASAGALWMALQRETPTTTVAQTPSPEREVLPFPRPGEEPQKPPDAKTSTEEKPEPKPTPEPEKKVVTDVQPVEPPKPEPTPPAKTPSDKQVEVGRYVYVDNRPGVLLRASRDEKRPWQRLAPEGRVASTDYLVSLPGYRSEVRLDSKVHLLLWGDLPEFSNIPMRYPVLESAVTLHENSAFDLDFTLERGRVVFTNHKAEGPARVRLRLMDEIWDVTLEEPASVVALELVSAYDPGVRFSKKLGEEKPFAQAALLVLEGQAGLKVGFRQFGGLRSPTLFRWDSERGPFGTPIAIPGAPGWWRDKSTPAPPFAKEHQAALNRLADQLTPKVTLAVALTEGRRSTNPADRLLALRSYGAIDDLTSLLDALTDEQQFDVRLSAIDVLRFWCGLRPDHNLRLFRLLGSKGISEPQAEIIMQMLHLFSQEEQESPDTYETLIEYLRHERLPIRELAYWHLRGLVPEGAKKIPYDPVGSREEHERAYEQWKKLIPKGKVPPRARKTPLAHGRTIACCFPRQTLLTRTRGQRSWHPRTRDRPGPGPSLRPTTVAGPTSLHRELPKPLPVVLKDTHEGGPGQTVWP